MRTDRVPLRDILVATGLSAGTSPPEKGADLNDETDTEPTQPDPEPEPDEPDEPDSDEPRD